MFVVYVEIKPSERAKDLIKDLEKTGFERNLFNKYTDSSCPIQGNESLEEKAKEGYIIQACYNNDDGFPPIEILERIILDKSTICLEANSDV